MFLWKSKFFLMFFGVEFFLNVFCESLKKHWTPRPRTRCMCWYLQFISHLYNNLSTLTLPLCERGKTPAMLAKTTEILELLTRQGTWTASPAPATTGVGGLIKRPVGRRMDSFFWAEKISSCRQLEKISSPRASSSEISQIFPRRHSGGDFS